MFKNQPGLIPTATDADTSGYSALQKKAVAIVSQAQKITQYFDRDTRSDFAGANGAQSLLQKFLANPTQDLAAYQKSIQDFWDQLPPLDLGTRILTPCQGRAHQPHAAAPPGPQAGGAVAAVPRRKGRYSLLTGRDKLTLALMVGIPTFLCLFFIWLPTIASVGLSFTNWGGITRAHRQQLRGPQELRGRCSPSTRCSGRPSGTTSSGWSSSCSSRRRSASSSRSCSIARCAARGSTRARSSSRSSCRWPSSGSSGSRCTRRRGSSTASSGTPSSDTAIDFLGNPSLNLWAVLVAASWRHVGYVMVLYLAGLKSVDPTLREAAAIDGANARQTFFRVVFPVMQPINVVVIVVTVIESLRAFDIVYIINKGKNGLELLSTLITNNALSEASLVGFGSAIAVVLLVISLVPIVIFLTRTMRSDSA